MWVSGALLESGHTFSKTRAMYVVCVSAFIVANNLSQHRLILGSVFHCRISEGPAWVSMVGSCSSPNTANTAFLIVAVNVPRRLRCFFNNYLKQRLFVKFKSLNELRQIFNTYTFFNFLVIENHPAFFTQVFEIFRMVIDQICFGSSAKFRSVRINRSCE